VLATQTLLMKKAKNMLVRVDGRLRPGCTAKDIVLAIMGASHCRVRAMPSSSAAAPSRRVVEGRMTVCNMAIEAGARSGMVAVDEKDISTCAPAVLARRPLFEQAPRRGAFCAPIRGPASTTWSNCGRRRIGPQVTWGTSGRRMVDDGQGQRPDPKPRGPVQARGHRGARLEYMA